jgi:hypothetical protein
MADEQKDLTGLLQYSQKLQESGQAPPIPEGSVMEAPTIEKIDDFESLEDYAAQNPAPPVTDEPQQADFSPPAETPPEIQEDPAPPVSALPEFNTSDFQVSEELAPQDFQTSEPSPPVQVEAVQTEEDPFAISPPEPSAEVSETLPSEFSPQSSAIPDHVSPPPPIDLPEQMTPPLPSASAQSPKSTLEKIKDYSEKVTQGKSAVPAAFPFSMMIIGMLLPEEKERLLDLLSRENMGIREIEIEPQLTSGKILIPRISEYAGVLLIQALRGTRAQIQFGPSNMIFSTPETREEETPSDEDSNEVVISSDVSHPAENLPLTSSDEIPGLSSYTLIDTVTATAALKSHMVEAESSLEYQEIIESLQREIKYKAYRKGATAILHFKIQMNFLSSPTHYRILVMGSAVRANSKQSNSNKTN